MSQSAVSGSLADLERQFDVQLFDRIGKRLQLSDAAARALRARAEAVLEQARELERGFDEPGASSTAARRRDADHRQLPGRAADGALHARAPGRARHAGRRQHRGDRAPGRELRDRRRPRRGRGRAPRPRGHALARRRAGGVLRARATPSRASARSTDDDLRAARLDRARARLGHAAGVRPRDARPPPRAAHRARRCSTPRRSRARSRPASGVGCVSRIALEDAFARGTLKPCRVPHRDFRRQFYFLLHKRKQRGAGVERWLAFCREAA